MLRPALHASLAAVALLGVAGTAPAQERTPAPDGAAVAIIQPADGARVTSPVTVLFRLSGMGVAPAGVEQEATGHHHLLINVDELPPLNTAIPADDQHRHFGGGQTEVVIDLEPGRHTLQLLLGDWQHIPHDPPVMSERISITVE